MQNLWDLYRSILARRKVDIADRSEKWAEQIRLSLEEDGAKNCFDKLCASFGCAALPLAIAVAIKEPVRSFGDKWQKIAGGTRQREQKIRTLEKAADALEDLLGSAADELIANFGDSIDTENMKAFRKELVSPGENELTSAMNGHPHDPAVTIRALRMYASILEHTTVTSPDLFARYLISAYVYRTTGDFHDAEVSSLIGAGRNDIYDAQAHKMWRKRNYQRLDKSLGFLADILTDFGNLSSK